MPRRVYTSEVDIQATPAAVWRVLMDLDGYPSWNPFTTEVRSSLVVGEPVFMRVRMVRLGITVSQRETLRAIEPERRIVWGARMLGGAIRAERVQTLEPLGDAGTRYRTVDTIEGPLGGLVFRFFGGSVSAGFDALVGALDREVQRRADPS